MIIYGDRQLYKDEFPEVYADGLKWGSLFEWKDLIDRWRTTDERLLGAMKKRSFKTCVKPFFIWPGSAKRWRDLWFKREEIDEFEKAYPDDVPKAKPGRRRLEIADPIVKLAREMIDRTRKPDGSPHLTFTKFIGSPEVEALKRRFQTATETAEEKDSFERSARRWMKKADPPVLFASASPGPQRK